MSAILLLLLPALTLSCPYKLVISSSADTKIDRGNQNYTSSTYIPYECDWRYNDAVCIWDSVPRSSGTLSFVEHFPLEAWMESTVTSATAYFRMHYKGRVFMNGQLVWNDWIEGSSGEMRDYLVYGRTNEFRVEVESQGDDGRLMFEVVVNFSQN